MLFPLPGVVHDGVEPVGDGQDGAVLKLGADGGLDQVVRLHVYSSRGLIQDQDLGLAEESASQADQLPLAQTEGEEESREVTRRLHRQPCFWAFC